MSDIDTANIIFPQHLSTTIVYPVPHYLLAMLPLQALFFLLLWTPVLLTHYAITTFDSSHYVPLIPFASSLLRKNPSNRVTFFIDKSGEKKILELFQLADEEKSRLRILTVTPPHDTPKEKQDHLLKLFSMGELAQFFLWSSIAGPTMLAPLSARVVAQIRDHLDACAPEDYPDVILSSFFLLHSDAFSTPGFLKNGPLNTVMLVSSTPKFFLPSISLTRNKYPLTSFLPALSTPANSPSPPLSSPLLPSPPLPRLLHSLKELYHSTASLLLSGYLKVMQEVVLPLLLAPSFLKLHLPIPHHIYQSLFTKITLYISIDEIITNNSHLPDNFISMGFPDAVKDGDSILKTDEQSNDLIHSFIQRHRANSCPILLVSFGSMAILPLDSLSVMAETLMDERYCVVWSLRDNSQKLLQESRPDLWEKLQAWDKLHIASFVSQKQLLGSGEVDLFHTHAGMNSIGESLARGIPMVLTPIFGDQFSNAYHLVKKDVAMLLEKEKYMKGKVDEVKEVYLRFLYGGDLSRMRGRAERFGRMIRRGSDVGKIVDFLEECVEDYEWCLGNYLDDDLSVSGVKRGLGRIPVIGQYLQGLVWRFRLDILAVLAAVLMGLMWLTGGLRRGWKSWVVAPRSGGKAKVE